MSLPPDVYMTPRAVDEAHFWPSLIPVQAVAPAASALFWVDTSTAPPTLKGWDGAAWVAVGGGGGGADPTKVPLAGGTMTGDLVVNNAKVSAGTTTDVLGTALEVKRNSVAVGRIDNNANGLRVQAQAGTLQLRGTGNTGIAIDAAGVADFASAPTIGGAPVDAAPALPIPAIGQYVLPWNTSSAGNPTNLGLQGGTLPMTPLRVTSPITINAMACRVMTNQAAVNAKILLYGSNANQQPGSLIVATAGFTCASGAINEPSIAATVLTPGFYWATIITDAGTTVAFLGGRATVGQGVTDSNGFMGSAMVWKANCGTYAAPAATATIGSMGDNDVIPTVTLKRSA